MWYPWEFERSFCKLWRRYQHDNATLNNALQNPKLPVVVFLLKWLSLKYMLQIKCSVVVLDNNHTHRCRWRECIEVENHTSSGEGLDQSWQVHVIVNMIPYLVYEALSAGRHEKLRKELPIKTEPGLVHLRHCTGVFVAYSESILHIPFIPQTGNYKK